MGGNERRCSFGDTGPGRACRVALHSTTEAIPLLHEALKGERNWIANHYLGLSYRLTGDYQLAIDQGEAAIEFSGRQPWALAEYGVTLTQGGQQEAATAVYDELVARSRTGQGAPVHMAGLCVALGRVDEDFQFLERAYAAHESWCIHL